MFLGLLIAEWVEIGQSLAILVVGILLGRWLIRLLIDRGLKRLAEGTRSSLDNMLLSLLRPALSWIFYLALFRYAVSRLTVLPPGIEAALPDLFFFLNWLVVVMLLWRTVGEVIPWYGAELIGDGEGPIDHHWLPFLQRTIQILIAAVGLITLFERFEIDISAMVTTLGIGSLAIALAAKESLSDMISGFIIMVDRPFRIGDRVELLDLDTWGDVMEIGLRSTSVRTRDNRMVIVPNSVIGKSLVVNYSYPDSQYRIQVHVGVGYGADVERARTTMVRAVEGVEGVLGDKPVEALFLEFGESAMIFRVRWWIDSYVDARRMYDRVNTAMFRALREAGIELPPPQRELFHRVDEATASRFGGALRRGWEDGSSPGSAAS